MILCKLYNKYYEGENMQRVGAIRKIDEVGRIVIPHDLRKNLSINANDLLEIYTDLDLIILKKYTTEATLERSIKQLKYDVINLSQELGREKVQSINKILNELREELKT